jgi:hypothetical protein
MTTGVGTRLAQFPAATGFSDSDLVFMAQSGATVKGTVAQLRTALSTNRAVETFVAATNFTAGVTTSLTLAGTYGSINNIDVYCDGVPQLDCTLSGNTLTFNPTIPSGTQVVKVKGSYANSIGAPAAGTVFDSSVASNTALSRRILDTVSIKDPAYGFTGGSVVDWSGILNRAIAAVASAGGGFIEVPPGQYSIASTITLLNGVSLIGQSGAHAFGEINNITVSEFVWTGASGGTMCVASAKWAGRIDGIVFFVGLIVGVIAFAGVYTPIAPLLGAAAGPQSQTLGDLLGLPAWAVLAILIGVAAGVWWVTRRSGGYQTITCAD